jgi:diaminopimelate decarboxylase
MARQRIGAGDLDTDWWQREDLQYNNGRLHFAIAPLLALPTSGRQAVTIAGHINEALDLFAEDLPLPPVAEGDFLAILHVGGYGSANSSAHCLRGQFSEYLL